MSDDKCCEKCEEIAKSAEKAAEFAKTIATNARSIASTSEGLAKNAEDITYTCEGNESVISSLKGIFSSTKEKLVTDKSKVDPKGIFGNGKDATKDITETADLSMPVKVTTDLPARSAKDFADTTKEADAKEDVKDLGESTEDTTEEARMSKDEDKSAFSTISGLLSSKEKDKTATIGDPTSNLAEKGTEIKLLPETPQNKRNAKEAPVSKDNDKGIFSTISGMFSSAENGKLLMWENSL